MKRLEMNVRGRVQGVFYRDTVCGIADEIGVVGYVKNLPDGSVEIVAEGENALIDEFAERVQIKKCQISVNESDIRFSKATGEFSKFELKW